MPAFAGAGWTVIRLDSALGAFAAAGPETCPCPLVQSSGWRPVQVDYLQLLTAEQPGRLSLYRRWWALRC